MANYLQEVKVTYGDFTFPVPSPYVSKTFSNEFIGGDVWATRVQISLVGQIALLPKRESEAELSGNNYLSLKEKRNKVLKAFAGALKKNFQDFKVEGHGTLFELKNCTVESVKFDQTNYVGLISYTIDLAGYKNDKDFYTANYGVSAPTDSWDYSEDSSGIASVTHNISATGYNTSLDKTDGFLKAKAFVTARKGTSQKVSPIIIQNAHPGQSLILNSVNETIDRLGGVYSMAENYSFATNQSTESKQEESPLGGMNIQAASTLLTYTLSIDEDHGSGAVTVNLSGSIAGSKESTVLWGDVMSDFRSKDFYALANLAYRRHIKGSIGSRSGNDDRNTDLHKGPVSFSITPRKEAKTIGFQISFDDNELFAKAKIKREQSYFDYDISLSHDNITDIIEVSCQGEIRTRGSLKKKNRDNKILLDEEILKNNSARIQKEAELMYWKMFPNRTQYKLSPRPGSITVSQNIFEGTIQYSATFSDKDFPENSKLRELGYSVSIVPSIQQYATVPSCLENGHYLIYDLNLASKREQISIDTNGVADDRSTESFSLARAEVDNVNDHLKDVFLDGGVKRLESQNKIENIDQSAITLNKAFSQEKLVNIIELNRLNT